MNILITGAHGFIGKNLISTLKNIRDGKDKTTSPDTELTLLEYYKGAPPGLLDTYCGRADFVIHLAGVNRSADPDEFTAGNTGFTARLLQLLKTHKNKCPVLLASSAQASLDNPYGRSKKACETLAYTHASETGAPVFVYRFPNVFGKWCRPNYNSVIATFCHNIACGLPITINDPETVLRLVYIDDVVYECIQALHGTPYCTEPCCVLSPSVVYTVKLGDIAKLLYSFRNCQETLNIPDLSDPFVLKLYATYISYLPQSKLTVLNIKNADSRGSFTELLRTKSSGQFSVNIINPGITKGQHWHQTKHEKFIAVSGEGIIRLRKIDSEKIIEYTVGGKTPETVDIPPGYTHSIENTGKTVLILLIWSNTCYDPTRPDTFYEDV